MSHRLHEASSLVTTSRDASPSVCEKMSGMGRQKPKRGVSLRMSPRHWLLDGHQAKFYLDNSSAPHGNPESGDAVVLLQQRQRPRSENTAHTHASSKL